MVCFSFFLSNLPPQDALPDSRLLPHLLPGSSRQRPEAKADCTARSRDRLPPEHEAGGGGHAQQAWAVCPLPELRGHGPALPDDGSPDRLGQLERLGVAAETPPSTPAGALCRHTGRLTSASGPYRPASVLAPLTHHGHLLCHLREAVAFIIPC